jgi:integrase
MVFLNADQIMTLADEITSPPIRTGGGEHRRRNYPERGLLVRFAGFTGLRSAEIVALRTESVDLLRGRVQVVSSATEAYGKLQFGPPKTYQRRAVPLPGALIQEPTAHLADRASDDFVFTSSRGGPLRHARVRCEVSPGSTLDPPRYERCGQNALTRGHGLRFTTLR